MRAKVGDTAADFTISCTDNGTPVDLTAASSVRILGVRGATTVVDDTSPTISGGDATHEWADDEVDTAGRIWLRAVVTWPGAKPQTFPPYGELAADFEA